jgi:2',3'-cyclic-nucleotide 2'-phosphodiesterase (5'-nucleotidase family)
VRAARIFALVLLLLLPVQAREVRLFLLHTNDIHGHLEADQSSGGFVRIATLIRAIKAAFPGQVILLDGGDMALGTPTSGLFFGIPVAESMQSVGYDAVILGNHEFDWGQSALVKLLEATGAPALCANVVRDADHQHAFQPWTVIEKGGVRLGIIGLVAPDTPTRTPKAYTQGWTFTAAEPAAAEAYQQLPGDVDAVIALTHIGVPADKKLADALPQLDLIVGGHSHTALQKLVVENGVPIVQAGCYSRFLGVLEILVDTDENSLKVLSYHLVPIDETIPPDPRVDAIVQGYAEKVRPLLDTVVAQVPADILNKPSPGCLDTPLGDLIADMLRAQTQADLAFYNRGGVREFIPSGPLAVRGLHKLFPFDDNVVMLRASGRQIAEIVKQGTQSRAKLSPSGLEVTVDKTSAEVQVSAGGSALDPDRLYTVATTNFLATGGDQLPAFSECEVLKVLPFTREVVQSYLRTHPTLRPPATGRVRIKS